LLVSDHPIEHYDRAGATLPTDQLVHPHAGLLEHDHLEAAKNARNREEDALRPGQPSDHPDVRRLLTPDFDEHGGLTEHDWNERYWPGGERDFRGNRVLAWPDDQTSPEGFVAPESRNPTVLEPGLVIDRFGPGFGRFTSPSDTPFGARGLPPDNLELGYHQYRVVRPIPVWEGAIAPAMGQEGGGTQYFMPAAVVDLVNMGYLEELTP
jgi:hypothetical protein